MLRAFNEASKAIFLKDESPTLSWNFVPRLIRICRIQWWCSRFPFLIGHILLGWPSLIRKSNCQSKLKFCTNTNLNTQNSMVMGFFLFSTELVKPVYMKNYSCNMFLFLWDSLEIRFKNNSPSNISLIDVNVNEGEIIFRFWNQIND